jgi:hypothetical protein
MADLIIINGRVWTGGPTPSHAQAIAIDGERIVAVGTNAAVASLRTAATRVMDAAGRRVLPGFNDAHLHFMLGAASLTEVDLKDASNVAAMAARVGDRAASSPGRWMRGGGWDEQRFAPPRLPSRHDIDPVSAGTPVFVHRYDLHTALVNSLVLRLAGIDAATPDPRGGTIVRDERGEPTGVLKDAAIRLVERVVPAPTFDERVEVARRGLRHAAALGLTSVQDMNPADADLDVYAFLAERGEMTLRLSAAMLEIPLAERVKAGTVRVLNGPYVKTGKAKGFADGSLGSTTALFFEPYADAPDQYGLLSDQMQPLEAMRERLRVLDAAGLQLCIHAIGDRAVSLVLDLAADLERSNGRRDRRFRIEHAQHVAPADLDRFAALGVVASVQPYHVIDDGRWAEARLGLERVKTTFPFRSFLDRGVCVAIGTDWPVAPLDPRLTLYAAVTRAPVDGRHPGGWVPEQKIGLAEAIEGYTRTAAFAEFAEHEKGTIAPGKLADLVVLGEDVFEVPAEAIRDVPVDGTIVGGRVVHVRGAGL